MGKKIWVVYALVVLNGCGGGNLDNQEDGGSDKFPPEITSTEPMDGAEGVPADAQIFISFSEAIDRNSLNADLFHLELTGEPRYGSVSYDLNTFQATLTMMASLDPGASYEGVLEPGVQDLKGNRMSAVYRWTFTVAR